MDVWSWISELPNSVNWAESNSPIVYELARAKAKASQGSSTRSIQLRAERTAGSNSDPLVTFSLFLQGFQPSKAEKTLWVSEACPLYADKPFLPLILQLVREIVSRSPASNESISPPAQLEKVNPDHPVLWILDTHSPESLSGLFNLIFLTRLFWLCVCDAPTDVGSLYFETLLGPNLECFTCTRTPVMRTFLVTIGVDIELCLMRNIGYILAKWFILREVSVGLKSLAMIPSDRLGYSYATETHGLWALKGYVPIWAMTLKQRSNDYKSLHSFTETKESVLKYALMHQHLEIVVQLDYSVVFHEGYIQVNARIDNLRLHVVKLGFNKSDSMDLVEEKHFPSRIRIWVGPEAGSTFVTSLSLGRSTNNVERKVETKRVVKGSLGKTKAKALTRTSTKTRNWRWDQDAEGNAAIFDIVLSDNVTKTGTGLKKRYSRTNRAFTKNGGVVFAKDEFGEGVGWRVKKEMEGSVLKWRIGSQIWLSYCPSDVNSTYFDTRFIEWSDEVDLPLIPAK